MEEMQFAGIHKLSMLFDTHAKNESLMVKVSKTQ